MAASRLSAPQQRWQGAALDVLLTEAGKHDRGPWVPSGEALPAIQAAGTCTSQAAAGALRALRTVGLADSCETSEGSFWKATAAAERMARLQVNELLASRAVDAGERATRLAERYGAVIVELHGLLNDENVTDAALRARARLLIAALDTDGVANGR